MTAKERIVAINLIKKANDKPTFFKELGIESKYVIKNKKSGKNKHQ